MLVYLNILFEKADMGLAPRKNDLLKNCYG